MTWSLKFVGTILVLIDPFNGIGVKAGQSVTAIVWTGYAKL